MKVSVIIPTKNEQRHIKRCLESIKKQSLKSEIIVVDNYSTDKTVIVAKKYADHVFSCGHERSRQRNYGLKTAKGKYVLFVDADMELEAQVITQSYQKLETNPQLSGIIINEISKGESFFSKVKNLDKKLMTGEKTLEAARFFRRKDLLKIKGYDENLISGEDWDLSQRMRKFGEFAKISAKIRHIEAGSFISDIQKKYYYAQNIQKYAAKHPSFFAKQAGFGRFLALFKKPEMILIHPIEFTALLLLKSAHFLAYTVARFNKR